MQRATLSICFANIQRRIHISVPIGSLFLVSLQFSFSLFVNTTDQSVKRQAGTFFLTVGRAQADGWMATHLIGGEKFSRQIIENVLLRLLKRIKSSQVAVSEAGASVQ